MLVPVADGIATCCLLFVYFVLWADVVKVQNLYIVPYIYPIAYGPMLIPGQLRSSLYSGAVITEGRCNSIHCLLWILS